MQIEVEFFELLSQVFKCAFFLGHLHEVGVSEFLLDAGSYICCLLEFLQQILKPSFALILNVMNVSEPLRVVQGVNKFRIC